MKTVYEIETWLRAAPGREVCLTRLIEGKYKASLLEGNQCDAGYSATLSGAIENAMIELREREQRRPVKEEFPTCPKCGSLPHNASALGDTGPFLMHCGGATACGNRWQIKAGHGFKFKDTDGD